MSWHYIQEAVASLYPEAIMNVDWLSRWPEGADAPVMDIWDEAKLGPLNMAAIKARCDEIAATVAADPAPIKAEAMRRILAIVPEWKQRNLTARAAELLLIGEANWSIEEQAEADDMQAVWDQVCAIRAASDAIEAMDPRPPDITADALWPQI